MNDPIIIEINPSRLEAENAIDSFMAKYKTKNAMIWASGDNYDKITVACRSYKDKESMEENLPEVFMGYPIYYTVMTCECCFQSRNDV